MNQWQKNLEQFLEDCKHAVQISQDNLQTLLKDNQNTIYGKRHHFGEITDTASYQAKVPISDYADYAEEITRMEQGEEDVLTVYPVKHFILSSGSTGMQKRIPLTKEALDRCIAPIYYAAYACVPGIDTGKHLHLSVFRMQLPDKEKDMILSAAYFRELHDRGSFALNERYLGGEELLFSKDIGNVPYVKLWIMLSSPEIMGIQAFFLYDVLLFLKYFEENWKSVLQDIKERRIPEELPLSKRVREAMLRMKAPDADWTARVEQTCRQGFKDILPRLWEKMQYISGVGGSTFFAQEAMLRYYLGNVPIHYFTYAASEGMIAVTKELESLENVLIPRSGFYEFIPYGKDGDNRARCIGELEIGAYYEVLITNFSGFYRYRLNDVIKVTGFCGQAPVFEVCFRKNQAINIAGEKMDLQTIAKAVDLLAKRCKIQVLEYSVYDEKALLPGRYQCFLETSEDKGEALSSVFDQILMELNSDYQDLRGLGLIGEALLSRVHSGTHLQCKERFMARQSNRKPLQYLTDPQIVAFMKERIC